MTKSLVALIFVMLVIVIIFLMFQVNDNSNKCRESKISDQDRLARASKLLVQSTTQEHPLLSFEAAIEAKLLIEEILLRHGGMVSAEKNLKLPRGRTESLRTKIHEQYDRTLERFPDLNFMNAPTTDTSSDPEDSRSSRHRARRSKRSSSHR